MTIRKVNTIFVGIVLLTIVGYAMVLNEVL